MQNWYNEAVAKSNDSSDQLIGGAEAATSTSASEQSKRDKAEEESKKAQKAYGEDGYRYPTLDFPATQESLNEYNTSVTQRIESKYETLIKNVHFYLAYLCLETSDYQGAVRHSEIVLKKFEGRITKKTQFTVMQYLAEAQCMLGQNQKALETLEEADNCME